MLGINLITNAKTKSLSENPNRKIENLRYVFGVTDIFSGCVFGATYLVIRSVGDWLL